MKDPGVPGAAVVMYHVEVHLFHTEIAFTSTGKQMRLQVAQ